MGNDPSRALVAASRHANIEEMRAAISKGAAIDYKNSNGKTSLHYAAAKGSERALLVLLNAGATECQDENGDTPLHAAAKHGHADSVKLLLERGADAFYRNKKGRRAIHEAMRRSFPQVVRCMEEALCPFRSTVTLHSSFIFGMLKTESQYWMVVHRARPLDNPAVPRRSSRVYLFSSKASALHDIELIDARLEGVQRSRDSVSFHVKDATRSISLSLHPERFSWLEHVMSDAFAAATGPAFDSSGRVKTPEWMLRQNTHFVHDAPPAAPVAPASPPRAAAIPGGVPSWGVTHVEPPRGSGYTTVVAPPTGATVVRPPAPGRRSAVGFGDAQVGSVEQAAAAAAAATSASRVATAGGGSAGDGPAPSASSASASSAGPAGGVASTDYDSDEDDDGAPEEFFCPITLELMRDPVFATDGHSYERAAITEWLKSHSTSPKTGAALQSPVLIPNHVLRGQLIAWREKRKSEKATTSEDAPEPPAMPSTRPFPASEATGAVAVAPPPIL